ncbi:hypothetical protein DM860_014446 [Cuscuta australis]|uniref:Uncharacterized protein n=1 Tax=Cuscuta australis TaxID=267555 RepID=A0A328DXL8_9ASTE|nr:hypothetical protein DM860_014446 [Cuscuta australis]
MAEQDATPAPSEATPLRSGTLLAKRAPKSTINIPSTTPQRRSSRLLSVRKKNQSNVNTSPINIEIEEGDDENLVGDDDFEKQPPNLGRERTGRVIKERLVDIKVGYEKLKTRSSPHVLIKAIKGMNEVQRSEVEKIGFGFLGCFNNGICGFFLEYKHVVIFVLQGDMVMRFFDEKGLGAKVLRLKGQAARHLEMPWRDAKTIHDYGVTTMRHMETYMGQSLRKWECGLTRGDQKPINSPRSKRCDLEEGQGM